MAMLGAGAISQIFISSEALLTSYKITLYYFRVSVYVYVCFYRLDSDDMDISHKPLVKNEIGSLLN